MRLNAFLSHYQDEVWYNNLTEKGGKMKKIICMAMVAVFVTALAVISFAEETSKTDKPMMGKGMMMGKPMMSHGMMGKGNMVATQDGGVVVMMGHKLYKYDKDLNLVKEAEVKIDMEGMKKAMAEMKEKCMASCDGTPGCTCATCEKMRKGKTSKPPAGVTNP